ncbi:MAG: PTS sugar transporter subunit IIB [Gemmatimonadota bacterium]|nr:PTS sugar transporter subunit IIB [Gemmatimonadota bacterium]
MPLVLLRIDDRLLHGQVLVGWGGALDVSWYVIADDEIAASEWERDLYAAGLPAGVEGAFLTVDEAARAIESLEAREGAGVLLTRAPGAMRRIAETGALRGRDVNLGGLHAAPGRRRAADYVYLSGPDIEELEAIERAGASVTARDLPGARRVPLAELVRAAR